MTKRATMSDHDILLAVGGSSGSGGGNTTPPLSGTISPNTNTSSSSSSMSRGASLARMFEASERQRHRRGSIDMGSRQIRFVFFVIFFLKKGFRLM